jgi:hypothetical protein
MMNSSAKVKIYSARSIEVLPKISEERKKILTENIIEQQREKNLFAHPRTKTATWS